MRKLILNAIMKNFPIRPISGRCWFENVGIDSGNGKCPSQCFWCRTTDKIQDEGYFTGRFAT